MRAQEIPDFANNCTDARARWESIANGAVRCEVLGLEGLLTLRVARINIGLEHSAVWDSGEHLPEHKFKCQYTGRWRARDQIFWLLRRVRCHLSEFLVTESVCLLAAA